MEDVLDVYKIPYNEEKPVICMDESSKQLIGEKRNPIPMKPGRQKRVDYEYERNGTCSIFMAFEPLTGKCFTKVTKRRTKVDWAQFIKELVARYSKAKKIILVMDNLNTHKGGSLYQAFQPEEAQRIFSKLEIHYTPVHASWLNVGEIGLSLLSRQCLNRRIPQQEILSKEVAAWTEKHNRDCNKVNWQFTTKEARVKLKHLYPKIES